MSEPPNPATTDNTTKDPPLRKHFSDRHQDRNPKSSAAPIIDSTKEDPPSRKHYLATLGGLIRLFEFICGALTLGLVAYYVTYGKKIDHVVTPLFLAASRETFLFVAIFISLTGNFHIILSESCLPRAAYVMRCTLFYFFFDLISFALLLISSVMMYDLYRTDEKELGDTAFGLTGKKGCSGIASIVSVFHLCGALCEVIFYCRKRLMQSHTIPGVDKNT